MSKHETTIYRSIGTNNDDSERELRDVDSEVHLRDERDELRVGDVNAAVQIVDVVLRNKRQRITGTSGDDA
jgi:uncharacterized protein (DUF2267 family)